MALIPDRVLALADADTAAGSLPQDLDLADPVGLALAHTAKIRLRNGQLQASISGADWAVLGSGAQLQTDVVLASELGILPTNTHAQNVAAWNAAMRAGTTPQRWLFEDATYLYASVLEVTRQVSIEGVAGDGTTGGTWFRFGNASGGGIWFRGYDNAYGRATASQMKHIRLDGDGTEVGILCNSRVTLMDVVVQSFDIGVSIFGNVGVSTEASGCHLERVFATQNTSWGIKTDGPDGNTANVINCTASDNGVGGFWDSSFLGCYWFGNHAERNGTYSYYNDDPAAWPVFVGNYSEAGQQCALNFPAVNISGIHGDGDGGFTGNALTIYADEVIGRAMKFPYRIGSYSGYVTLGGGYVDVSTPWSSLHVTPEAVPQSFYNTWNNGAGFYTDSLQHYIWGSYNSTPAFEVTSASSNNNARGFRADIANLAMVQFYLGTNRHRAWDYYEQYGTPVAYALSVFGIKTLVTGDIFYNFYTNATQGGLLTDRQSKYAGYIVTKTGTLGTYPDGRTATTNGTQTFVLSGANTTLAVGQYVTLDGNGPYRISAISGTSVTCVNTSGGGSLAALASTSGRVIAFPAPEMQPFGLIGGMGADSTGSPGAATQETVSGRVAIASGASSVVVTNARVTSSSNILATIQTADGTLTFIKSVVPGSGSFTITGNANATGNVNVGWFIVE